MSADKKFIEFHNGQKMPNVGLGTWQSTPDEIRTAIRAALDLGYRHIDTAFVYKNEKAIGDALKEIFAEGKIKRQDLFIVTKLPANGIRPKHVEHFLRKSLEALQLDYIDLYLIHMPIAFEYVDDDNNFPIGEDGKFKLDFATDLVGTWKKMEDMVDLGLAKSIGVSNFSVNQLKRIVQASRIKPANNQVECHAYFSQQKLLDYCNKTGITICAYAPLGSPGLTTFLEKFMATGKPAKKFPSLLEDPTVQTIAKKYKKAASQILLRWLIQRGIAVIPKSVNPGRIKENFDVFDFQLEPSDVKAIDELNRDLRMFNLDFNGCALEHPEYKASLINE